MAYYQVTYRELITHADKLGVQVIPWDQCKPSYNDRLGTGTSMNVFSGTCEINGIIHTVAFKSVNTRLTETTSERKRSFALRDIKQEIRIMGCLKGHSCIVQLLGVSFDDHMPILILELAKSNLEDYLQDGDRVEWKIKLGFMYDIALGLEAIHKIKVVHGDLKAANILICDDDNGHTVAKISDFGFSSADLSVQEGRTPGFSYHFRSRECFDTDLKDWNGKPMTDIYSYGLVVYQIAHDGTVPFDNYGISEIDNMKKEGTELEVLMELLPDDTPVEIRKVMTGTIRNIPSERLDLDKIKDILKESTEWNQANSYEEAKTAFESLAQVGFQETIEISRMMKLSIPPSLKRSIFLEYQRLADAEDTISQQMLGSCWYFGFGTDQDYSKAAECYAKAAEAGNVDALANLGTCYIKGQGVAKDDTKAIELYSKAAEAGNIMAQTWLGFCYKDGRGVAKDYTKAIEMYTKAAEGGNTYAQYNLGVCYEKGDGVPRDYIKATELFTKAAEAGSIMAQCNLGVWYKNGYGVPKDDIKAVELLTKAANAGNADAQYNLGVCYDNGEGVTKDHNKAMELYAKAAAAGNFRAQHNLENQAKKTTSPTWFKRFRELSTSK